MKRPLPACLALGLALSLATPSCQLEGSRKDWFRRPEPRPRETLFSPLDLPAPNRMRTGSGAPGPDYWQQEVDYRIEASLEPDTRRIGASARITYTNHSPDPLDYLWLHLEQNVFRADSIGSRVGRRAAVAQNRPFGEGIRLRSLEAAKGELEYRVYDTLARVELPEAIPPGGGVFEFDLSWEFLIPEQVFRRFGIESAGQGEIFEVAQWFPAVAVYDDVHGWNTDPYIGTGEFYTNFGDYDVRLRVPWDHLVVATGSLLNPEAVYTAEQLERLQRARTSSDTVFVRAPDEVGDPRSRPARGGILEWHFSAERVRTFAWASSKAFIQDAANSDGVLVQSVYPAEALPVWEQSTQMLKSALEGLSRRWYPYPWPVATNVSGSEGGMEYPMLIFCGGRASERALWEVVAHEIGHNWFPMLVNTDERRHAWMDEGFDTFLTSTIREDWFGPSAGMPKEGAAAMAEGMLDEDLLPVETPPDHLPLRLLGRLQYSKSAAGLKLLREVVLGEERFDYAFKKYIERWAFKSPRPADFFRCMEDAAGANLAWFWRGWYLESAWLDQAVGRIVHSDGESLTRVEFENRGPWVMPLEYRITWDDGEQEDFRLPVEVWFHSDRIVELLPAGRRVRHVLVDPEERLPDVDRSNNAF